MKGPWRVRRGRRKKDAESVWVVYRLVDACRDDVEGNREYYHTAGGVPVWSATEQGARTYARIFNAVRQ